jgi:Family of unknown function (DUF6516)
MSNTKANLLMRERRVLETGFIEVVVWRLPEPLSGSTHSLKYRLAYVVNSECVLCYDNEAGKGDHQHVGTEKALYVFVSVDQIALFLQSTKQCSYRSNSAATAARASSSKGRGIGC